MSSPDLEAQATPRIKDALNAAIERTGRKDFATISGIESSALDRIMQEEGQYVPVAIITLACQVNRSHNDPEVARSSISECLKGAILRLPAQKNDARTTAPDESSTRRNRRARFFKVQKGAGRIYDPAALRILGFSVRDRTRLGVSYRTRVHVLLFCEEALAGLPCRSSPYDFELATRRQGLDLTDLSHV